MEKFVNEVMYRLSGKLPVDAIKKVRDVLYSTLQNYEVTQRVFDVAIREDDLPTEAKIYLVSRKIDGYSDKTLDQYERTIRMFFASIRKPICDVKTEDCRLFFYHLQQVTNMNETSLNNQRNYLNAFFNWITTNEYIQRNPCAPIKPFKCEKKRKKVLSDMEMEKLRNACKDEYEIAVIEVLYSTACRVSELVNIRLDEIDFNSGEVEIKKGKGKKDRVTYLSPKAILAVQNYIKGRDYDATYLFERQRKPHGHLGKKTIETKTKAIGRRTGIEVYPHKIRRTTATHLWKKGMPLEEIRVLLGHEDINTTLIYTKLDNASIKADHQKYI